jgi:hypothetical protein
MLDLGGLGIALTLGIAMRIAGWGGFALNIMLWFSRPFPPSGNPVIDGEHMAFAFGILLLMFLHAGNRFGLGRWWEAHTPALIHYRAAASPHPVEDLPYQRRGGVRVQEGEPGHRLALPRRRRDEGHLVV